MDIEKQEQAQTAAPQSQQIQRNEVGAKRHPLKRLPVKPQVLVAAVVILAVIAVAVVLRTTGREKPQPQVLNTSTLEKIINVSELSTFTAVYNGIAEVANEKKPDQIDYYVSYEATVNAGIDFQTVGVSMDEEQKIIT